MKKLSVWTLFAVLSLMFVYTAPVLADSEPEGSEGRWVIGDVLDSGIRPFAIGHRGYGENDGSDPEKPIENTTKAVRRGFREGVQIVEVDAVLTRDQVAVALHDDFLEDGYFTCVNSLDFEELKDRLENVSSLRHILQTSRTYSSERDSDRPSGQVVVEIKTPSPLCDPTNITIPSLVDAVLGDIAFTRMKDQVTIESYSPEILALVRERNPGIPRMLAVDSMQLAHPDEIRYLGYLVNDLGTGPFGLPWGEIGVRVEIGEGQFVEIFFYRLPGYYTGPAGEGEVIANYIYTLMGTESRSASIDKFILLQTMRYDPSGTLARTIVESLHQAASDVLVFTVDPVTEWSLFSSFGVDGMYVDDIPEGVARELGEEY